MSSLRPHLSNSEQRRLWDAVHGGNIVTVRRILEPLVAEPDTDINQFRCNAALHIASKFGMEDLVDQPIAAGATVALETVGGFGDLVGETPLHEASAGGHASVCAKLITAGASVDSV